MTEERTPLETKIEVGKLNVWFGEHRALRDISFSAATKTATSLIGPGGCGKTTLLRALNRMHDLNPDARVQGSVKIDGAEMLGPGVDTSRLRRVVGMIFSAPTMLPGTVADNIAFGLAARGVRNKQTLAQACERALRRIALWEQVGRTLQAQAATLPLDLQKRVSIARAIAIEPEILLIDDPTAGLDPVAALAVEDVLARLRRDHTLIIATNDLQQAARLADVTMFMSGGEIVEKGETPLLFNKPGDLRTEAFLAGAPPKS